jgi:hypothetical protein
MFSMSFCFGMRGKTMNNKEKETGLPWGPETGTSPKRECEHLYNRLILAHLADSRHRRSVTVL